MTAEAQVSDEVLMRRFCETLDERYFRELAGRHYATALRVAQERLGNEALAQDAVQEAFIRTVRFRKRYDAGKPFAQWFYTVLRNACTDLYRKEQRHQEALADFAELAPAAAEGDNSSHERVRELAARLAPEEARVLRLRFVEGLSLDEMGRRLDCSLEAAKKRVQRLLKRLKPELMQ